MKTEQVMPHRYRGVNAFSFAKWRILKWGLTGALLVLLHAVNAQTATLNYKRVQLANSGCSALLPGQPDEVEISQDADSNLVFITRSEAKVNGDPFQFCVTALRLRPESEGADYGELLEEYLDYFKSTQNIVASDGYKKINSLLRGKTAHGVADTWTDQAGNVITVNAWASGRTIAVLYIMGNRPLMPVTSRNTFLNGFQFPSAF